MKQSKVRLELEDMATLYSMDYKSISGVYDVFCKYLKGDLNKALQVTEKYLNFMYFLHEGVYENEKNERLDKR